MFNDVEHEELKRAKLADGLLSIWNHYNGNKHEAPAWSDDSNWNAFSIARII